MKKLAAALGLLVLVLALFLFTRRGDDPAPEADAVSIDEETSLPPFSTQGIPSIGPNSSSPRHGPEPGHGHDHGNEPPVPAGHDPLEGRRLSREEFQALASQVNRELPSKASLSKLQEKDVHLMPEALRDAALQLGTLAQAVENEPSLKPEAFTFYESCAAKAELPDSVRALCFSNYKKTGQETGQSVNEGIVPDSIRELAAQVEGL